MGGRSELPQRAAEQHLVGLVGAIELLRAGAGHKRLEDEIGVAGGDVLGFAAGEEDRMQLWVDADVEPALLAPYEQLPEGGSGDDVAWVVVWIPVVAPGEPGREGVVVVAGIDAPEQAIAVAAPAGGLPEADQQVGQSSMIAYLNGRRHRATGRRLAHLSTKKGIEGVHRGLPLQS
jgi:hypothetical protein